MTPAWVRIARDVLEEGPVSEEDVPSAESPTREVIAQLEFDYPPEALDWISGVDWEGPVDVPLDEIDYSNHREWRAWKERKKVKRFAKRIEGGWKKPVILMARPGKKTLMVVDGHHRSLAYAAIGMPVRAFVGHAPTLRGPWDWLHDSQREKERV